MVRAGSDEALKVVGAASVGFAAGLFFGGANRFLGVIAALVPAALVGPSTSSDSTTTPWPWRGPKPVQRRCIERSVAVRRSQSAGP